MSALRIEWTVVSKQMFEELRKRAIAKGKHEEFARIHNEIAASLRDLDRAVEMGEPLYRTQLPGGEVRHCVHRFISVCYVVFKERRVGWVLQYRSVPENWPDE